METEQIHYGMALIRERKTLEDVISSVFNFPTLHDLYAGYDAPGNIRGKNVRGSRMRVTDL